MKTLLKTAILLPTLFGATAAFANPALVTSDLNLRTGPSTGYRVVTAMPDGAIVDVSGCTRGYNWCRVDWNGYRGWASSHYLAQRVGPYRGRVYADYGSEIGIPLVAGAVIGTAIAHDHDHYWRHHHRHWRHHHRRHARHLRHRIRRERRHLRHLRRRERRAERRYYYHY